MILSPGALAIILMMPVTTRMIKHFQPKYLIALGFFICGLGIFYTRHFSPVTNMQTFISMRILTVMGLPFLFFENTNGGHAASANLQERAERVALEFTYLARKLMD